MDLELVPRPGKRLHLDVVNEPEAPARVVDVVQQRAGRELLQPPVAFIGHRPSLQRKRLGDRRHQLCVDIVVWCDADDGISRLG